MSTLPTGTVTFLFTDIENSTTLWDKYPDAMTSALVKHDSILKEKIETNHGRIIKTTGDGVHAVFETAADAIKASLDAQQEFQTAKVTITSDIIIRVRMGLHTGEADLRDGDYYGGTLNRAARIMSIGHGGQVLISGTTLNIAREHLSSDVPALDLGHHQLKGLSKAEHIYQISTSGLQQEFPALKSQTQATNNLPTQLTSFVGRERELAEAKSRLLPSPDGRGVGSEGPRLLTLIGPGGTGKTRLSIQLGTQLVSNFKDGVWLVEFAPISDPSLILQTIASVFDIGEVPGVPLKTLLHDFMREKQLLLILDNCEHLVEASAKVADELLHIAPNIKIISSSREALGINGETVYRVPSLSLPDQDEVTKEAVLGFESVQLFVERASAANRKFQLTDENASFVAQICSRLDGIPLAIELAASRITVFSPELIAKRLDDRFKLLTGGSRTALPRQQTLRALIDWSYDLLSEEERALLRRLSVFAGGWTFEAAETICNNVDVFEHLPQLINKSLVTVNDEGDEPRYFLLETIRQYARDKLLENGEGEGTRNRHLTYYREMAEAAFPELSTRVHELEWLESLETEFDNVRTAVEWGLSNDPVSVMRIVLSLPYFMAVKNASSEGHRWGEEAIRQFSRLNKSPSREEILYKAKLLTSMSMLSFSMGDSKNSFIEVKEATGLLRSSDLDDRQWLGMAFSFLVSSSLATGNMNEAIQAKDEAIRLAQEFDEKSVMGSLLMSASVVESAAGNFSDAIRLQEEATEIMREYGSRWIYGLAMYGLANIYSATEQFDKAREIFNTVRESMQELGSTRMVTMIKSDLAHILRREGNYSEAFPAYHETIKEWQRIGHRAAVAHQLECLAFIAKSLEQVETATKLLGAAEALRQRIEIDMTPQERKEYEKEVVDLKANMDEKDFASLWAEGRSMTMEQAIAFALEETNE